MTKFEERAQLTDYLKKEALALRFFDVKVARAEFMSEEARRLEEWLNGGNHGQMSYMENHFDLRTDPTKLVAGAKSVVVMAYNYYTERSPEIGGLKIARYAHGKDYHKVIKKKLKKLYESIQDYRPSAEGRYFVDSGPVLERDWARRAGLGWVGKNTLLLHRYRGSYFFLAVMILTEEFIYDQPIEDFCGSCTRCIDACPTDAIAEEGYTMDGSKCISYLTIELKDSIPEEFSGKMERWIFGCDICQEVCPWNRFSKPHQEPAFEPKKELLEMNQEAWRNLDQDLFDRLFLGSTVRRTKISGLRRNIDFVSAKRPKD